jgi:hypothetical protein
MRHAALLLGLAVLFSCERVRYTSGEGCSINSDCVDPLVCVIDVCRRQCVDSRDCGAGLRCIVPMGSELGGGCQLPEEARCALTSDCRNPALVCQNTTCTTPCRDDRDCALGARCTMDAMGVAGCYEETTELCIDDSDCPAMEICDRDQICRPECLSDRDCTAPRTCVAQLCELPDGGP